jgi:hypothetical protein
MLILLNGNYKNLSKIIVFKRKNLENKLFIKRNEIIKRKRGK